MNIKSFDINIVMPVVWILWLYSLPVAPETHPQPLVLIKYVYESVSLS